MTALCMAPRMPVIAVPAVAIFSADRGYGATLPVVSTESAGEGIPVRSQIGAAQEREDQQIDQFWMLEREGVRAR